MKAIDRYMGRVAAMGCITCRLLGRPDVPAQLHHPRAGQGAAQRADDALVIPLCPACHQGKHGVHGDKGVLRQLKMTELDLLALVIREQLS